METCLTLFELMYNPVINDDRNETTIQTQPFIDNDDVCPIQDNTNKDFSLEQYKWRDKLEETWNGLVRFCLNCSSNQLKPPCILSDYVAMTLIHKYASVEQYKKTFQLVSEWIDSTCIYE